jgi:hypothetical protein
MKMKKINDERLARYNQLAARSLWDIDNKTFHNFFARAAEEGVELVSNNFNTRECSGHRTVRTSAQPIWRSSGCRSTLAFPILDQVPDVARRLCGIGRRTGTWSTTQPASLL